MAHYRAYLLDQHRHVISVAKLQCADEQEARELLRNWLMSTTSSYGNSIAVLRSLRSPQAEPRRRREGKSRSAPGTNEAACPCQD
jgi:hypothetical protein